MKNKKVKIILSVFVAVVVIAAATIGINYGLYISGINKAMSGKFGAGKYTDIVYTNSVMEKTELSLELKKKVWDFMLNNFEKYEMTQEELDKERYAYAGGFSLTFNNASLSLFDRTEIDGKQYSIYCIGEDQSLGNYYAIELKDETAFNKIFRSIGK